MLDKLFKLESALTRHRATIIGPHLDGYLQALWDVGHRESMLCWNLWVITRFGEYLGARGVREVGCIRQEHVASFVRRERSRLEQTSRSPGELASRTGHVVEGLLRHLETRGTWRPQRKTVAPTVLDDFYRSLVDERGLRPRTIENYRFFLDPLLRHVGCDGSAKGFSRLTPRAIDAFLIKAGRTYSRTTMRTPCMAIRELLRFLYRARVLSQDLSSAVVRPRFYAMERLPCALPWASVRRMVDGVDVTTARGLKDRAILLLLATYGVRPGEVLQLRLEDIDWRQSRIHFRRRKAGRPLTFPVMAEVGEALVDYLRRGRPAATAPEVFVRLDAPHVPYEHGHAGQVVREHLARAGIESKHRGAYVIRHSLAVRLLRKRHPLKVITDVLGHMDVRSAYSYTKLGVEDLHAVALPAKGVWP